MPMALPLLPGKHKTIGHEWASPWVADPTQTNNTVTINGGGMPLKNYRGGYSGRAAQGGPVLTKI